MISSFDPAGAHAAAAAETLAVLEVDPTRGLTHDEAARRVELFGANAISGGDATPWHRILLRQFAGAVVWLLIAAAVLSAFIGDVAETVAIVVVLALNGAIGFLTESRAVKSMAALKRLTEASARVVREGADRRIDAGRLAPGDIVRLEAGDLVPADLRLVEATDLHCDESALTGESAPVEKTTAPLPPERPLADRTNVAYRGASVTRGVAVGVVIATGRSTELGWVAELTRSARSEAAPIERRLDRLGRQLATGVLAAAAVVGALGILAGHPFLDMLETGIALAVAAAPEGLPIVATLALARGMWRMADRNALVNRLAAVETLGSASLLITDKTGTLTENRMTVDRFIFLDDMATEADADRLRRAGDGRLDRALRAAALCNDASLPDADGAPALGDPMELALLEGQDRFGAEPGRFRAEAPRLREAPFDPDLKLMATVHAAPVGADVAVKGAPEAVLQAATAVLGRDGPVPLDASVAGRLSALAEDAAANGLRLLGLAEGTLPDPDAAPYEGLTLIGFVGLVDPPRRDVAPALRACATAGVRVVMATGDHPATARKIARDVGLATAAATVAGAEDIAAAKSGDAAAIEKCLTADVFARTPPAAKLDLVALHQANGATVGMTGDGVNDAPALRKADIGIAMGQRGTQVAAEASEIILRDDAFASIVAAMREGRIIYGNIRVFVRYLFSCNLSEILLLGFAVAIGLPLPLLPLQILFLNLVTDVFPALALGFGEGTSDVMRQRPRPRHEPLLAPVDWIRIGWFAVALSSAALAAFLAGLYAMPDDDAPTLAFLSIAFGQLWLVLAFHGVRERIWSSQITRNFRVWLALATSVAMVLTSVWLEPLAEVLALRPPSWAGWLLALGASLAPLCLIEAARAVLRRPPRPTPARPA